MVSGLDIRVWSHDYTASRRLTGHMGVELTEEFGAVVGSGTFEIPSTHPLAPRLMQASYDVVPVTAVSEAGWEWTGRVRSAVAEGKPGSETIKCELVDDMTQLSTIRAWPSTRTGLGLQGKYDYQLGPLHTVAVHYLAENIARCGLPAYVMMPPQRIRDKSPFVDVSAKMHTLPELLQPFLEEHEYNLRVRMWWPGQPFPEGKMVALPEGLSQFERFSRVTLANLDVNFAPDGPRKWEPTTPGLVVSVEPTRKREHVRFSTSGRGVDYFRLSGSSPQAVTAIVGGVSDEWVKEIVNLSIDTAVQGILMALGSTAGPAGAVIGAAAGNFLKNQLEDVILAYQSRTDVQLAAQMGPFHPRETFQSSSSGAFTFDTSALAERTLLESAGGQSVEISLIDGYAVTLGDDSRADNGKIRRGYRVGDRCTFEEHLSGAVVSDLITAVTVSDKPGERMRVKPRVGKRRNLTNPFLEFTDGLVRVSQRVHDMGLRIK